MAKSLSKLMWLEELFPPTPRGFSLLFNFFRAFPLLSLLQWTPLGNLQAMGKTSSESRFNLPGRYAWAMAESIGPLNLLYVFATLPSRVRPLPQAATSLLGTGLPIQSELLGILYLVHYVNRAIISPLYLAPSMSPIHPLISLFMVIFQFTNSSNIACWLTYSVVNGDVQPRPMLSIGSVLGLSMFAIGLALNIKAENQLFELRRGAAKRKARSEGKAQVTFDKVYVIPPAEGLFKHILFPHYAWEWFEWTGYWILAGSLGFGFGNQSPALWFVVVELATMLPRAVSGRRWYEERFGKRAVAGRAGAIAVLGL